MDDDELRARFDDGTLPPAALGHAEHLRLAWLYLRDGDDFGAAAPRFRAALQRYVAAIGRADRYHETLTWAWLALVHERMRDGDADARAFLARCPELADPRGGALAACYGDVDALIVDPRARRVFVLPRRGGLTRPA